MDAGATLRITCPSCGLSRTFAPGRAPEVPPHRCPRCGADLVAEGLLAAEAPPAAAAGARAPWFEAPARWEAIALALFAALLAWSWGTRGFLAAAVAGTDLVFHEAGHPIFGLFGWRFLTFLGGTLGQLAFPAAAAVAFARRRRAASFAVALTWLGFNLVEIGRYAADAADRVLPLLAPDQDSHDWWNLLGMLGVRDHCRAVGGVISSAGWALWLGAPAWAAWRALRSAARLAAR